MTLAEKVKSVEEVFQLLDSEIVLFQTWSGLRCASGCGKCCLKADINATILEFLPLAFHVYKQNKGIELYEKVSEQPLGLCVILDPINKQGMCGNYTNRGMICRVFGFTARVNKYGKPEMITCSTVKVGQERLYKNAIDDITNEERSIPLASRFYRQLMSIDDELGKTLYPVNTAIKKALEVVMHYYAYRDIGED